MKTGLFVTVETEAHAGCPAFLDDIKQHVRIAKEAGFNSAWVPRGVLAGAEMRQFAASPMPGFLAGIAEGMRFGAAVPLPPMLTLRVPQACRRCGWRSEA